MLQKLSDCDLIAINETWCENEADLCTLNNILSDFICYSVAATRVSKHGRPSGGTCIYVRHKLNNFVRRIAPDFKYGVILELTGGIDSSSGTVVGTVLLVCTYLPPQNSTSYQEELNGIELLREKLIDLKLQYTGCKLVVAGDLNARVGTLLDYIQHGMV